MTSKSLFFKLMKEDLKQKLWAVGLAFLGFFFSMPVLAAMRISELKERYEIWIVNGTEFENGITADIRFQQFLWDSVEEIVGPNNILNMFIIVTAALVMALIGFLYLHSKKQMDFFHSIPVRREMIFAVKYLNGIFIILAMYVLNLILSIGVFAMNGVTFHELSSMAFTTSLIHLGGYLSIYGLMTIAVMLTGNFFVSILGGIVLFVYVPAVIVLFQGLQSEFFMTYNGWNLDFGDLAAKGSPVSFYVKMMSDYAESIESPSGELFVYTTAAFVAAAIMAAIAMLLYKKRPSESAGKAMAFSITKAPINVMIVAPVTIAMALVFWSGYNKRSWAVFGFVFALIVTHCIIEIIYHFEFRKLFANLKHMAVSAVIALVVLGSFRYDIFGYDHFLPTQEKLKSASVCMYSLGDWISYGLPQKTDTGEYIWKHFSEDTYAANNMKITDYQTIEALANAGIMQAEEVKAQKYKRAASENSSDDSWSYVEVGYTLKNGKTVYRNYYVNLTENRSTVDTLYALPEYKTGVVPVLSYKPESVVGIYTYKYDEKQKADMNEETIAELLEVYKEEYIALTLEERVKETPVISIRFLTSAEADYLKEIARSKNPNYNGDLQMKNMNDVNFFPVYPSFVKTIALLKQAGISGFESLEAEKILRIEVYSSYYEDEYYEYQYSTEYTVSNYDMGNTLEIAETGEVTAAVDESDFESRTIVLENDGTPEQLEKLQEILDGAVDTQLARKNDLQPVDYGVNVHVFMKDGNEGKTVAEQSFLNLSFPKDQIPEYISKQFHLDQIINRNITDVLVGWE